MLKNTLKWIIKNTVFRLYTLIGRWYLAPLLRHQWKSSVNKTLNERSVEYGFACNCLARICPREILDVGSGTTSWPHIMANCGFHVTAVDKIKGYWSGGFFNQHYYIINDDITHSKLNKQFDFITCISVLEHIPDRAQAVKAMFFLLKPGGHLLLTFPFKETQYVDNVYQYPGSTSAHVTDYICQVYSRNEINGWLESYPSKIVDQEYYQIFNGDLWSLGERMRPPQKVDIHVKHHLTCLLIQKQQ